jgi:hypothetical protein
VDPYFGSRKKLSTRDAVFYGVLVLFQLHVLWAVYHTLWSSERHFLIAVGGLVEATVEGIVSLLVQGYSTVYYTWENAQLQWMLASCAASALSIAKVVSLLDVVGLEGAMARRPGTVSFMSPRHIVVAIFRAAEVVSSALALVLFQFVTRPYGVFAVAGIACLVQFTAFSFYLEPRGRDLVLAFVGTFVYLDALLDEQHYFTIPARIYYSIRLLEYGLMLLVLWFRYPVATFEVYARFPFTVYALAGSLLIMFLLLVFLRSYLQRPRDWLQPSKQRPYELSLVTLTPHPTKLDVKQFFESICLNPNRLNELGVTSVSLFDCTLDDSVRDDVVGFVKANVEQISTLCLAHNKFTDETGSALANALKANNYLSQIELAWSDRGEPESNVFTKTTFDAFTAALQDTSAWPNTLMDVDLLYPKNDPKGMIDWGGLGSFEQAKYDAKYGPNC